jgi:hypothetical protein
MSAGPPPPPSRWWADLADECPITLEPLSTLPYPPFRLGGGGGGRDGDGDGDGDAKANASRGSAQYFDGLALASYCVSRATFANPLTREDLTWDDCVRLDDYLEEHCYASHRPRRHAHLSGGAAAAAGGGGRTTGRISVKEAYGLKSMVKVSGGAGGSAGTASTAAAAAQEEANRRRAEALRSEAAAALRGLFVYGNNRTGGGSGGASTAGATASATFANSGEMVPSAGFALHRLREGGSTCIGIGHHHNVSGDDPHHRQGYDVNGDVVLNEVEGLRIIDDDAVVAFESDEAAWREVQQAFPTIGGSTDAEAVNAFPYDDVAEHPERSALLRRAKEVAAQTKQKEAQKRKNEERGRQILIEDALKRRAEKLRLRREKVAKEAAEREAEKAENEDMARARAEIERWREEQFNMLNGMAEETRQREAEEQKKQAQLQDVDTRSSGINRDQSNDNREDQSKGPVEAVAAAGRTARKKAAKRKKERERQKVKRAAEKKEQERLAKIEEEKKRRAEAKLKCAHCCMGILDEGFEKMGHIFCTPKCARAGAAK